MVTALNKIDRVPDQEYIFDQVDSFERAVPISARRGDGVDTLLAVIERVMFEDSLDVTVELPYKEGHLISIFHDHGEVASVAYDRDQVVISGKLPQRLEREFRPYLLGDSSEVSG
jgi:GTP-binding protein HflX